MKVGDKVNIIYSSNKNIMNPYIIKKIYWDVVPEAVLKNSYHEILEYLDALEVIYDREQ